MVNGENPPFNSPLLRGVRNKKNIAAVRMQWEWYAVNPPEGDFLTQVYQVSVKKARKCVKSEI